MWVQNLLGLTIRKDFPMPTNLTTLFKAEEKGTSVHLPFQYQYEWGTSLIKLFQVVQHKKSYWHWVSVSESSVYPLYIHYGPGQGWHVTHSLWSNHKLNSSPWKTMNRPNLFPLFYLLGFMEVGLESWDMFY